jgi:hypothetical protein
MTTSLAQNIKQQILVNLQTLVTNGVIQSYVAIDKGKDPFGTTPDSGYPFAIVGMPQVANDMEDTATNLRKYRFDILFVMSYEGLQDPTQTLEGIIDAVLNQFDTNFTLGGAAVGAIVPPAQVQAFPVSTGNQDLACFVVSLEARQLYTIGT